MHYGLLFEELEAIKNIFRNAPEVEEVILFGSRAKGNFRPGSDIDLAAKGAGLTFDHYLSLLVALDELELLYNIDVVNYNTINNKDLLDHIHRVGIPIYQREEKQTHK